MLDARKANGTEKYGLSQNDFYQIQTNGHNYLDSRGDVVLIYPRTASFHQPLPTFEFPKDKDLRLWVLPFCCSTRQLIVPDDAPFVAFF